MMTKSSWQDSYQAALLEADWTKVEERVQTAESDIRKRLGVLSSDYGGTPEERIALARAMNDLRTLRMDTTWWLEQSLEATPRTKAKTT